MFIVTFESHVISVIATFYVLQFSGGGVTAFLCAFMHSRSSGANFILHYCVHLLFNNQTLFIVEIIYITYLARGKVQPNYRPLPLLPFYSSF